MRGWAHLTLAAAALTGAACMVGPKYTPPQPPTARAANYKESPVNFQNSSGWDVASPSAAMLRGQWWQIFGDAELNGLEDRLNINNQTIAQYFENFMEARTLIAEARATYWPTVTLNPQELTSHGSANAGTGISTASNVSGTHSLFTFPLDLSWEPDLWGKVRNEVRAAQYGAQVSAADLENEKLTEQADLAEYFFELRGEDKLQQVLDQTVQADQTALDLTQNAYAAGVDQEISVVEARAALEAAQSQASAVAVLRGQYEHAIAVLVGAVATDFYLPVRAMVYDPPAIPTGVPSELVERRPDVAAAERTLAEANAEIGIGYGAFFPQLTITGEAGFESTTLGKLFSLPSRIWSVGPSISQIVFDGWLYQAELQQYQATYYADLASYRATVLTAFQQVEDYLVAVRADSVAIGKQTAAVTDAQTFFNLELARYRNGIDPYVDVLTAQTTLLSDEQQLVSLQVDRMTAAVELVQALGGGWDASQLPGPAAVGGKAAAAAAQPGGPGGR